MTRKALIWTPANRANRKGVWTLSRFSIPSDNFLSRCYTRQFSEHFMLATDRSIVKGIAGFKRQDAAAPSKMGAALALRQVTSVAGKEGAR